MGWDRFILSCNNFTENLLKSKSMSSCVNNDRGVKESVLCLIFTVRTVYLDAWFDESS